jgi:hypothetical protein
MKKNGQCIGKRLPIAVQVIEKPVFGGAFLSAKCGYLEEST